MGNSTEFERMKQNNPELKFMFKAVIDAFIKPFFRLAKHGILLSGTTKRHLIVDWLAMIILCTGLSFFKFYWVILGIACYFALFYSIGITRRILNRNKVTKEYTKIKETTVESERKIEDCVLEYEGEEEFTPLVQPKEINVGIRKAGKIKQAITNLDENDQESLRKFIRENPEMVRVEKA